MERDEKSQAPPATEEDEDGDVDEVDLDEDGEDEDEDGGERGEIGDTVGSMRSDAGDGFADDDADEGEVVAGRAESKEGEVVVRDVAELAERVTRVGVRKLEGDTPDDEASAG